MRAIKRPGWLTRRRLQWGTGIAVSVPFVNIIAELIVARSANPIEEALNALGWWALFWLLVTLSCTPAKSLLGWTWPNQLRRILGLWSFVYALFHWMVYMVLDQGGDWAAIWEDVIERKFITVGFVALVLLAPLAVTSTDAMVRSMGFGPWKRLHRLAYAGATAGVVHFYWRVKADTREPLIFAGALMLLMGARVFKKFNAR